MQTCDSPDCRSRPPTQGLHDDTAGDTRNRWNFRCRAAAGSSVADETTDAGGLRNPVGGSQGVSRESSKPGRETGRCDSGIPVPTSLRTSRRRETRPNHSISGDCSREPYRAQPRLRRAGENAGGMASPRRGRSSRSAGRPTGTEELGLLPAHRWDKLADPKRVLYEALRAANGARGRRAKSFKPGRAAHRLADLITDWTPLRILIAFTQLEADTRTALEQLGLPVATTSSARAMFSRA